MSPSTICSPTFAGLGVERRDLTALWRQAKLNDSALACVSHSAMSLENASWKAHSCPYRVPSHDALDVWWNGAAIPSFSERANAEEYQTPLLGVDGIKE